MYSLRLDAKDTNTGEDMGLLAYVITKCGQIDCHAGPFATMDELYCSLDGERFDRLNNELIILEFSNQTFDAWNEEFESP